MNFADSRSEIFPVQLPNGASVKVKVTQTEGEIEKFTEAALEKRDELRQKIKNKLRGKPRAEKTLSPVVRFLNIHSSKKL